MPTAWNCMENKTEQIGKSTLYTQISQALQKIKDQELEQLVPSNKGPVCLNTDLWAIQHGNQEKTQTNLIGFLHCCCCS